MKNNGACSSIHNISKKVSFWLTLIPGVTHSNVTEVKQGQQQCLLYLKLKLLKKHEEHKWTQKSMKDLRNTEQPTHPLPPPYTHKLCKRVCVCMYVQDSEQPAHTHLTLILLKWYLYKVVQIWPGQFVCKQVTVCPSHIWTTFYFSAQLLKNQSIIWTEKYKIMK
jgi:hypothetical protein